MRTRRETPETLLEALVSALRACDTAPDGMVRPAAILWTDPKRQWLPLKSILLQRLPELIVLGDYDPASRTGPAIWIRCVVERTLENPEIPEDRVPVVYLPGVARQDLRAGEDCPAALTPLVELMHRGTLWLQRSGHDWTVTAFLTSPQGLELDLARDQETLEALARALREVAETPVARLRGRRLEAEDFDRLLSSDVVRDLLRWMSEPAKVKEQMGPQRWAAFCNQCRAQFGLDPGKDSELIAGERLGRGEGPWADVWERFEEAPRAYPGIPDLLRRSKPHELFIDRSRWPDYNEEDENTVRRALAALQALSHPESCRKVLELEEQHAKRRGWVWSRLGLSPMAAVLEPLARLAGAAQSALGGSTPHEIAKFYMEGPWEADAATWEAIALAPTADEALIKNTVRILLEQWLDESARVFQRAVESHPLPGKGEQEVVVAKPGMCLLFADGLRYDVGRRLAERLEERGCNVRVGQRWAALPTVTATAKPSVTPAANNLIGDRLPEDFTPVFNQNGKPAETATLRSAIEEGGYQIQGSELDEWECREEAVGWSEAGALDQRGHDLGEELARHIVPEIERLAERIMQLFDAGWTSVRVVTDHGWLLVPGGMPKVDLPKHLTITRWKRCAVVAGESQVEALSVPWYWNKARRFATAPGIACFNASPSYAHGGLSVQECLIPDLLVEQEGGHTPRAAIRSVTWRRMRCFVEADSTGGTVTADLRLEQPNGKSVVASAKPLDHDGTTSLVVEDDYEERNLVLVLLDQDGNVLTQRKTKVGVSS
ncbi:MAG: BREX-1 system phosphatase PglZ type B [Bacillota bacterium]